MADTVNHPSFSLGRKFGAGVGVLIACLSALLVIAMLNYLAGRHFIRADFTASQRWELSSRTLKVLEALPADVRVIVYYSRDERLYKETTDLLREYAARSPHIKLEFVDPDRDPVQANLLRTKYRLAALNQKNLVLFDCSGKTRAVYQQALADYELEPIQGSREHEYRRHTKTFRGEQQFTSALISVINPRQLKAYFLQGHGEQNPASDDEQMGYSKFTTVLAENGIQAGTISLLGSSEVPPDCSLLIIAGPADPLTQDELAKIDRYLNAGGRMLALFNYRSYGKRIGLESLLAGWGVVVGESIILDPMSATSASRGQDLVLKIDNATHPVTRPLMDQSLQLLLPRAVSAIKSATGSAETLRVDELLHTSPDGVMVSSIRNGFPEVNPARDRRGSFSIMAAVEKGTVPGVRAERGSTRMIICGDSMFLDNQLIESLGNREFASHAVNWLVDQTYLLAGVGPRPVKEYRLNLTNRQLLTIHLVLLGAMPASVLFLGTLVWLKRRK